MEVTSVPYQTSKKRKYEDSVLQKITRANLQNILCQNLGHPRDEPRSVPEDFNLKWCKYTEFIDSCLQCRQQNKFECFKKVKNNPISQWKLIQNVSVDPVVQSKLDILQIGILGMTCMWLLWVFCRERWKTKEIFDVQILPHSCCIIWSNKNTTEYFFILLWEDGHLSATVA